MNVFCIKKYTVSFADMFLLLYKPFVGDISRGKKARLKKFFCNLIKVKTLNKIVGITSLQHYSF